MSLTLEEIVEETRLWPEDAVAELIDRIVVAKHGGLPAERAAAWAQVAEERLAEIQQNPASLLPGHEVSARIRKIVGA